MVVSSEMTGLHDVAFSPLSIWGVGEEHLDLSVCNEFFKKLS